MNKYLAYNLKSSTHYEPWNRDVFVNTLVLLGGAVTCAGLYSLCLHGFTVNLASSPLPTCVAPSEGEAMFLTSPIYPCVSETISTTTLSPLVVTPPLTTEEKRSLLSDLEDLN